MKWIEPTLIGESLLKTAIEGKMLEKMSRGRPRNMMLDWMMVEGHKKLKKNPNNERNRNRNRNL